MDEILLKISDTNNFRWNANVVIFSKCKKFTNSVSNFISPYMTVL